MEIAFAAIVALNMLFAAIFASPDKTPQEPADQTERKK